MSRREKTRQCRVARMTIAGVCEPGCRPTGDSSRVQDPEGKSRGRDTGESRTLLQQSWSLFGGAAVRCSCVCMYWSPYARTQLCKMVDTSIGN